MCGVCGEIRFDSSSACASTVRRMAGALDRRGPDGSGFAIEGRLAFGHRRLAIIDLSDRAAQPMIDAELGLGIVYNGAVYNHLELRVELEAQGYRFMSSSDTEVLLKAYHAWGEEFVERLDGMFAFALWERATGRVLIGRDRLGIKPLYFARTSAVLRFASSLPALLAAGGIDTEIDPVGLNCTMTFQGAIPAPRTLLQGVRKLPPATLLRVEPDGELTGRVYWRLRLGQRPDDDGLDEGEWCQRVLDELRNAVRRRLQADVPVGILLSGGLDSSLITALVAEVVARPVKTFSIGFEAAASQSELAVAGRVAEGFGTEHHGLHFDVDALIASTEDSVQAMSEPIFKADAIGFYLLARRVSEEVKVVLCGQGADELFAGYDWYPMVHASSAGMWTYARRSFDRNHRDYLRAVDRRYVGQDWSGDLVAEHFSADHASSAVDHALHFDTTMLLPEDPLKRVDDMTMAWGVEGRVPFLSHRLVELAARMPIDLKLHSGGKHVLKQMARPLLPREVMERPKAPFPVPPLDDLQGPCLGFVRDVLGSRVARERGLFKQGYVESLLTEHPGRGTAPKLWQAAILELWLAGHVGAG